jgi:hypothetical protein
MAGDAQGGIPALGATARSEEMSVAASRRHGELG